MAAKVLLLNPAIHDFAAYDFWLKPLSLLTLAASLKRAGAEVELLDLLDIHHPALAKAAAPLERRADGSGKFYCEVIPKPVALKSVRRRYKRYGLSPTAAKNYLAGRPRPDLILVGSLMTYWYPGVAEAVATAKAVFPGTPLVLGGLYATLLPEHAARCGADAVAAGRWEDCLPEVIARLTGLQLELSGPLAVAPDWSLYRRLDHAAVLTGRGCVQRCRYCVAHRLHPRLERKPPGAVVEEIAAVHRDYGVRDFAFYDDALLEGAEGHAALIAEGLIRLGLPLRLHAPNGLSLRAVTPEMAALLKRSGFVTLRFGLETTDPDWQTRLGPKAFADDLHRAVENLTRAGYAAAEIGVYLLIGLPGRGPALAEADVRAVLAAGGRPYLSEYSPVPGSPLWEEAVQAARYDIAGEPLYHNNTLMSCAGPEWTEAERSRLKAMIRDGVRRR